MTWIALSHAKPSALPAAHAAMLCDDVVRQGSLFLEADLGLDDHGAQTLFMLHRHADVTSHISVMVSETGEVVFGRRLGPKSFQVTLNAGKRPNRSLIRVWISWDAASKWGLLTLEQIDDGTLFQKEFSNPLPWLQSDIALLRSRAREITLSPALRGMGVSNAIEPVGIAPTLARGTPVLTPGGYRPIEHLRAGDAVVTDQGPRRLLWTGTSEVPAFGRFAPILLLSPYLGMRHDVVVAPEQLILIDGPEVEYLFGEEAVLVPAHSLLHTPFARCAPCGPTIHYHQLLLEDHCVLDAAGGWLGSLFVGQLRDTPEVLANTMIASLARDKMPRQGKLAYPALREYEAVTLRAALLSR